MSRRKLYKVKISEDFCSDLVTGLPGTVEWLSVVLQAIDEIKVFNLGNPPKPSLSNETWLFLTFVGGPLEDLPARNHNAMEHDQDVFRMQAIALFAVDKSHMRSFD